MFTEILNKIQESTVGIFFQHALPQSFEIRPLTEPVLHWLANESWESTCFPFPQWCYKAHTKMPSVLHSCLDLNSCLHNKHGLPECCPQSLLSYFWDFWKGDQTVSTVSKLLALSSNTLMCEVKPTWLRVSLGNSWWLRASSHVYNSLICILSSSL